MYQKFLPQGCIGIQVLTTKNFDSVQSSDVEVIDNHILSVASLDKATVEDHTLVLDDDFELI